MTFSGAFIKPFRPAFDAGLAAAAVPWYLAGGALPATIINAHQAKGATSYAGSLLDLGPAGNHLTEHTVVPSWNAAYGWRAAAPNNAALLMPGTISTNSFSWYLRYSNVTAFTVNVEASFGAYQGSYNTQCWIIPNSYNVWTDVGLINTTWDKSPWLPSAVLALTSAGIYSNGVWQMAVSGDGRGIAQPFGIFAYNKAGTLMGWARCDVQATARYNVQHDATTVADISAAMAAL